MNPPDLYTRIAALGDAVDQVRQALLRVEIGCCDLDQLALVKGHVNRLSNMCGAPKSDIAVRASQLRVTDHSNIVDDTLNPCGRESAKDELVEKERADVLENLPGMDDATRSGELSASYADVIGKLLANQTNETRSEFYRRHQDLAELAAKLGVVEFRQYVEHVLQRVLHDQGIERKQRQRQARRASKYTDFATGMRGLTGRWDPLAWQQIDANLTAEVNAIFHVRRDNPGDARTREQILADALENLICGTRLSSTNTTATNGAATPTRGGRVKALVITDRKTVDEGPHDASIHEFGDGTPIDFDTLRDILDDPETEIDEVTTEHGIVIELGDATLNLGRTSRFASDDQRLALRVMHRNCIFPGCTIRFDHCEQHHLIEWQHHGRTDLIDLGPTCVRHHHQLHKHDWKLRFDPETRDLTIRYPDGTSITHRFRGLAPPRTGSPPDKAAGEQPSSDGDVA